MGYEVESYTRDYAINYIETVCSKPRAVKRLPSGWLKDGDLIESADDCVFLDYTNSKTKEGSLVLRAQSFGGALNTAQAFKHNGNMIGVVAGRDFIIKIRNDGIGRDVSEREIEVLDIAPLEFIQVDYSDFQEERVYKVCTANGDFIIKCNQYRDGLTHMPRSEWQAWTTHVNDTIKPAYVRKSLDELKAQLEEMHRVRVRSFVPYKFK